jgi:predicted nucleic acid-binding protein
MKYLLDSNILIYHLNNESIATQFLIKHQSECAISQITFMEVLSFDFSIDDEKAVKELLDTFLLLDVTKQISLQAIKNRTVKKIKLPDNIIAATAMISQLTLVTRNVSDFNALDLTIFNPFDIG